MTYADDAARDPRNILDAARAAAGRGDYQLAGALFSRLIGNPDPQIHVAALLGLADARYRLDDEEGALQAWITATQAPETPLTWQAWVQLAGARVREGDLTGRRARLSRGRARAPYEERAGIQSRLGLAEQGDGQPAHRAALLRPCPNRRVHAVRDLRDHRHHGDREPVRALRPEPN